MKSIIIRTCIAVILCLEFSYANEFRSIRFNDVKYVAVGRISETNEFIEICRFVDSRFCKRMCEEIQIPGDESVKKIAFEKGPYVVLFDDDMNPIFSFECRLDGWNEIVKLYQEEKKWMIERSVGKDRKMFISGRLGQFNGIAKAIREYHIGEK